MEDLEKIESERRSGPNGYGNDVWIARIEKVVAESSKPGARPVHEICKQFGYGYSAIRQKVKMLGLEDLWDSRRVLRNGRGPNKRGTALLSRPNKKTGRPAMQTIVVSEEEESLALPTATATKNRLAMVIQKQAEIIQFLIEG